jgi:hypothetical protein
VIALLVSLGLTGCLFAAAWLFAMAGVRAGDRPGDTMVSAVGVDGDGVGIRFTVHNRGRQAVLLGASLRRRSLRLWQSNASYVSVPRRTARGRLSPGEHALVCVVEPDDRMVVRLAPPPTVPRRQELVVAIGEPDRLRVLHRAVTLPRARRAGPPPVSAERLAPRSVGTVDADSG